MENKKRCNVRKNKFNSCRIANGMEYCSSVPVAEYGAPFKCRSDLYSLSLGLPFQ